jgi:hypothetical protein
MRLPPFSRRVAALVAVVFAAGALAACQPVKTPVNTECTQYWRGYVLPGDHNYAGIGAFTGSDRYMCKPTPEQGVRAQMQHLRNYADPDSHYYNLGYPFEPRPRYDEAAYESFAFKGVAPSWVELNGRWAVPGTTYGQRILQIYNDMLVYWGFPAVPVDTTTTITGTSVLTANQIAGYVNAVIAASGLTWKPEISPVTMAGVYLDEGTAALVKGDIAFCQSILETAWFAWPNSPPPAGTQSSDVVLDGYFELQQARDRN